MKNEKTDRQIWKHCVAQCSAGTGRITVRYIFQYNYQFDDWLFTVRNAVSCERCVSLRLHYTNQWEVTEPGPRPLFVSEQNKHFYTYLKLFILRPMGSSFVLDWNRPLNITFNLTCMLYKRQSNHKSSVEYRLFKLDFSLNIDKCIGSFQHGSVHKNDQKLRWELGKAQKTASRDVLAV